MRLDLFLKVSRLIARRSLAQESCDAGLIEVNGAAAKSSKEIKAGDKIEIRRRNRITKITVLDIPAGRQVSKTAAQNFYTIIADEIHQDENALS